MSISTFCGMILSTKYARPRKNVHRSTEIAAPVWETEWLFCSTLSGQPSIGTPKGCLLPADALFYLNIVNDKIFWRSLRRFCVMWNATLTFAKSCASQFGRKVNVLNVVFIIKLLKVYYHRSMKRVRNKIGRNLETEIPVIFVKELVVYNFRTHRILWKDGIRWIPCRSAAGSCWRAGGQTSSE